MKLQYGSNYITRELFWIQKDLGLIVERARSASGVSRFPEIQKTYSPPSPQNKFPHGSISITEKLAVEEYY